MLALVEGVLAANIFDWGSRACVDLYHKGTIIEIYRMSRKKMHRPWRASADTYLSGTAILSLLRSAIGSSSRIAASAGGRLRLVQEEDDRVRRGGGSALQKGAALR